MQDEVFRTSLKEAINNDTFHLQFQENKGRRNAPIASISSGFNLRKFLEGKHGSIQSADNRIVLKKPEIEYMTEITSFVPFH